MWECFKYLVVMVNEKTLVIVESPAKAKAISQYLGSAYTVVASMGHVRDLPSAKGSVVPENNFELRYEIKKESKKNVDNIIAKAKGVSKVLLASDPDREGEAISWNVAEILKAKKIVKSDNIKRISFNEITKKSVLDAVSKPRDIDQNLVDAQQARLSMDYLVGFEISPILWRKLPGSKSAGRVQSVALRLIADRELEIRKFISQEYWTVHSGVNIQDRDFKIDVQSFEGKKFSTQFPSSETQVDTVLNQLNSNKKWVVDSVDRKEVKISPTFPFITSVLQQEGSKKLGFTSKKTMQVAQKLYEGIDIGKDGIKGLITYMRTDGTSISEDAVAQIRDYISKNFGGDYLPAKPIMYKTKVKNAQEAHEAIRPTDINLTPSSIKDYLTKDEYSLYELIWLRTVACQMTNAIKNQDRIDFVTPCKKITGKVTGSRIKFDGFLKVYNDKKNIEKDEGAEDDGETVLPNLNNGDEVLIIKNEKKQHFTSPPYRYTEASLIKKMEELGIGRPSTYASIVSILQDRGYVKLIKRQFHTEELGVVVSVFLCNFFSRYVEFDFTAQLEMDLDLISSGEVKKIDFMNRFWKDFSFNVSEVSQIKIRDVVEKMQNPMISYSFPKHESESISCAKCETGKLMFMVGKNGSFFGCSSYPECKNTLKISGQTGEDEANPYSEQVDLSDEEGRSISIKTGKYGRYLEVKGTDGEVKRKPLPASIKEDNHDMIKMYASLPKKIGDHPEGGEIMADIGKYGPYLKYAEKFYSIKNLEIDLESAVKVIESKNSSEKSSPSKIKFKHPSNGDVILVGKSKHGVYALYKKKFYGIDGFDAPEDVTIDDALNAIGKSK